MKRKIEVVMAVVVIAAAIFAAPKSAQYVMSMKAETMPAVIVIDAGHGGSQLRKIRRKAAAVPKRLVKFLKKMWMIRGVLPRAVSVETEYLNIEQFTVL